MDDGPGFTIHEHVNGLGPHDPPPFDADDPGYDPGGLDHDRTDGWQKRPRAAHDAQVTPYRPLSVIDPREWAGKPIPEREWIVRDWLPAEGEVTGNWGGGGDGKTILAQQLQVACATGARWIGLEVETCPTLGIYCEDSDRELHRRFNAITAAAGLGFMDLGDMRCASAVGEDNALVSFGPDGSFSLTPRFEDLVACALRMEARLLVVDTASDTFGGGNENNRGQVRTYISAVLRRAAIELKGAVLLNAHPSRAGISSGTMDGGSTGWSNSVRSRWALTRPPAEEGAEPDRDARVLTRMKANYASIGDTIQLRWNGGLLVPENPPEGLTYLEMQNKAALAERVFLDLLDRLAGANVFLSASRNAGNYAPKKMAAQPDRSGLVRPDFEAAMNRLIAAGKVHNEDHGRPGRERFHLARKPEIDPDMGGTDAALPL